MLNELVKMLSKILDQYRASVHMLRVREPARALGEKEQALLFNRSWEPAHIWVHEVDTAHSGLGKVINDVVDIDFHVAVHSAALGCSWCAETFSCGAKR